MTLLLSNYKSYNLEKNYSMGALQIGEEKGVSKDRSGQKGNWEDEDTFTVL